MRRIKAALSRIVSKVAAVAGAVALGAVGGMQTASAQTFSAISATDVDNLLGVSTSGSETGIHELAILVPVGLAVCVAIAIAFAGYHLVRRLFMRAQSA